MTADGGALLLVDKPAGLTSHDVVRGMRSVLGTRRIGHTGTLDPFATGLLLLCVGPLTRMVEYFHLLSKTYRAAMRLGAETTTCDLEGEITERSEDWQRVTEDQVRRALAGRVGSGEQVPPVFSAKRVDGVRAYERARAGETPTMEPSTVIVHSADLADFNPPDVGFETCVSTGTYIRALARDLGRDLGCGAHLTELRRVAVGPFRVEDAASPDAFGHDAASAAARLSPLESMGWLPYREVTETEQRDIRHGRRIPEGVIAGGEHERLPGVETPVLLVTADRLLGIAERRGTELQPRKVLANG